MSFLKKKVRNQRYESYLSIDTSVCVGLLVWIPQACEAGCFFPKDGKGLTFFQSAENLILATFFSK